MAAGYYFRLIFGSAKFTRTGENSAKLRLKAEKCSWNTAKTISLKQGL